MATKTLIICDLCLEENQLDTPKRARLSNGVILDLCAEHSAKLTAALKAQAADTPEQKASETGETHSPKTRARAAKGNRKRVSTRTTASASLSSKENTGSSETTPAKTRGTANTPVEGKTAGRKKSTQDKTASSPPLVDMAAVRAWAASNGYTIPKRGPMKKDVVEAFIKADQQRVPPAQFKSPDS